MYVVGTGKLEWIRGRGGEAGTDEVEEARMYVVRVVKLEWMKGEAGMDREGVVKLEWMGGGGWESC